MSLRELESYMETADNAMLQTRTQQMLRGRGGVQLHVGEHRGGGDGGGGGGGGGGAVLDALGEMFPALARDALADALAACGGDAELAAERLLAQV